MNLPVTCWCERGFVKVPRTELAAGRTRRCGRTTCAAPDGSPSPRGKAAFTGGGMKACGDCGTPLPEADQGRGRPPSRCPACPRAVAA